MMLSRALLLLATAAIASARPKTLGLLTPEAEADLVTDLPGLNFATNFTQYSGYLDGGPNSHLHYWFIESVPDPTAPLLLWLNGGPGCSSLTGLLTELGPFYVNEGGHSLRENPESWNTFANIVYLESPACVGFSYSSTQDCSASDDSVAENNYHALKEFFARFPSYRNSPFYVTGESYGGIYVPTLSVLIVENNAAYPVDFQGYAIGNGLSSYTMNDDSLIFFANYHTLVGQDLWDSLVQNCCDDGVPSQHTCHFSTATDPSCQSEVYSVYSIVYGSGLNMYNLYADCIMDAREQTTSQYTFDLKNLFKNSPFITNPDSRSIIPCLSTIDTTAFLNRADVRKALHIPDNVRKWAVCSDIVSALYSSTYPDMTAQHLALYDAGVRGLFYNGDVDMACNFIADEWFSESLNFPMKELYRPYTVDGQVAGFVKAFNLFDVVTIKGSGHMVPQDKPKVSLHVIKSFVEGTPY